MSSNAHVGRLTCLYYTFRVRLGLCVSSYLVHLSKSAHYCFWIELTANMGNDGGDMGGNSKLGKDEDDRQALYLVPTMMNQKISSMSYDIHCLISFRRI